MTNKLLKGDQLFNFIIYNKKKDKNNHQYINKFKIIYSFYNSIPIQVVSIEIISGLFRNNPGANGYKKSFKPLRQQIIKQFDNWNTKKVIIKGSKKRSTDGLQNQDYILGEKEIIYLNKFFKKNIHLFNSISLIETFMTGSNVSGADSDPNKTPYFLYEPTSKDYHDLRFINPFKKIHDQFKHLIPKEKNSRKLSYEFWSNQKINSITDFLKMINCSKNTENNEICQYFYEYLDTFNNNTENWLQIYKKSTLEKNKTSLKEIDEKILAFNNFLVKERNIFREKLEKDYSKKQIFNYYKNENISLAEAAHIIPFFILKNEALKNILNQDKFNYYKNIIQDVNNGIFLDPTTHKVFDKNHNIMQYKNDQIIIEYDNFYYILPDKIITSKRLSYLKALSQYKLKK